MQNKMTRREVLVSGIGLSTVAVLGTGINNAFASSDSTENNKKLTPDEKKKLKEQLQRELERKVYAVEDELFREINYVKTPGKYEGHEKGHLPVIEAPKRVKYLEPFTVKIKVGPVSIHDMIPFHYIDWISLYVDKIQTNNVTITPLFNLPIITLELTLDRSSILRAQEHCNLHGIWESEPFAIEVIKDIVDKEE